MTSVSRRTFVAAMTAGATLSAGSITSALAGEPQPALTPGTYAASAHGMISDIEVEVTFGASSIDSIEIASEGESPLIGETALDLLPQRILDAQSLAVDVVSGATITSMALLSAVGDCVEQAGGDASSFQEPVAIEPVDETVDTDVLVIGSGIAALSAAVAAMKDGASVAVIEKEDIVGGTSAMAEGYFFSTNTGDADGLYQLFCDRAAKAHSDEFPVDSMLHVLADNNDAALDMIRSTGVDILPLKEFTDIAATESGEADTKARSAWRLIESLSRFIEENGGAIYTATPATELLVDASGAVVGAVSDTARGKKTLNARATVLACGDYARNADMMRELIPQSQACYTVTAVGNTGDGMTLGASAGAQFYPDQYVQGGPLIFDPTDVYRGSYSSSAFASTCMIASLDGDRRVGEDKGTRPIHYSYTNHEKADGAWCIMDSTTVADCEGVAELVGQTTPDSFVQAYEADSLFHLALATQMNPEVLIRSVERYNALCEGGEDSDCGKDAQYLVPLVTPPFYAVRGYAICRGSLGGLVIDEAGQALDENGEAIAGLYAAGTMASRPFFSRTYDGGSALGIGATMGYVAGRAAAKAVKA